MTIQDQNNRPAGPTPAPQMEGRSPTEFMPPANAPRAEDEPDAVFLHDDLDQLRPRWNAIQTRFIDEPRKSVEEADGLVTSTITRLAETFASERTKLESQWAQGSDVSTEDLRLALRRYRSFFDRLLSV